MKQRFKKGDLVRLLGFERIGLVKGVGESGTSYYVYWFNTDSVYDSVPEAVLGPLTESWAQHRANQKKEK